MVGFELNVALNKKERKKKIDDSPGKLNDQVISYHYGAFVF